MCLGGTSGIHMDHQQILKTKNDNNNTNRAWTQKQHFISPPSSRGLTSKDPQEISTSGRGLRPTGKPRLSRSPGRFHGLGSLCAGRAPDGERGPETQPFPLSTCHLRGARGALARPSTPQVPRLLLPHLVQRPIRFPVPFPTPAPAGRRGPWES